MSSLPHNQWIAQAPVPNPPGNAAPVPPTSSGCDPTVEGIDLTKCLTLADGRTVAEVYDKPTVLLNLVVSNVFVVAGILILFLVFLAGFKMISNSTKGMEEAKTIATAAGFGIAGLFSAYWIVQIIQLLTGANILL